MPSFSDSIFLFILALLLFGPKKLPVLARELGKWVGEFRRASNEFKMQMEEELRLSEQEDRRKQIAAMEAAAPPPVPIEEPEHPHLQPVEQTTVSQEPTVPEFAVPAGRSAETELAGVDTYSEPAAHTGFPGTESGSTPSEPLPIAVSGDLRMMPPATGLPTARSRGSSSSSAAETSGNGALSSLVNATPHLDPNDEADALKGAEGVAHSH